MCGMGRTGRWFAVEHDDVVADLVTLGKAIPGGTLALSAVRVQSRHLETIRTGGVFFIHRGTYSHHPVAVAAGLAAVGIMEEENLVEAVGEIRKRFIMTPGVQ